MMITNTDYPLLEVTGQHNANKQNSIVAINTFLLEKIEKAKNKGNAIDSQIVTLRGRCFYKFSKKKVWIPVCSLFVFAGLLISLTGVVTKKELLLIVGGCILISSTLFPIITKKPRDKLLALEKKPRDKLLALEKKPRDKLLALEKKRLDLDEKEALLHQLHALGGHLEGLWKMWNSFTEDHKESLIKNLIQEFDSFTKKAKALNSEVVQKEFQELIEKDYGRLFLLDDSCSVLKKGEIFEAWQSLKQSSLEKVFDASETTELWNLLNLENPSSSAYVYFFQNREKYRDRCIAETVCKLFTKVIEKRYSGDKNVLFCYPTR